MIDFKKYINHVRNIKIKHQAFANGLEILENAYTLKENGFTESYGVAIIGESRVGKTTLIITFLENHKIIESETGRVTRCALITVPVKPTSASICEAILEGLGDPFAHKKDTEGSKRYRVVELIKRLGVQVLILDEMQHFVSRWTTTVLHDAADSLKIILDDSKVLIVVAGLEYGRHLLQQNDSLKGRINQYVELSRFNWSDRNSRLQFQGLLKAFQKSMDPFQLPDISSEDLAYRFYISSGGLMGYVINVIESAMHLAINEKKIYITVEHFMKAHDLITMESNRKLSHNPFNLRADNSKIELLAETAKFIGTAIEMDPPRRRARLPKNNQLLGIL